MLFGQGSSSRHRNLTQRNLATKCHLSRVTYGLAPVALALGLFAQQAVAITVANVRVGDACQALQSSPPGIECAQYARGAEHS